MERYFVEIVARAPDGERHPAAGGEVCARGIAEAARKFLDGTVGRLDLARGGRLELRIRRVAA